MAIYFNLYPHRAERDRLAKKLLINDLVKAGVGALVLGGIVYGLLHLAEGSQQGRNDFLSNEIVTLDAQIKDVQNLKSEIQALQDRQKAVEDLQANRNMPVRVLSELRDLVPEGIYLTEIRQVGDDITFTGVAQDNETISELLRALAGDAIWITNPQLGEVKAVTVGKTPRDRREVFDFSIKARQNISGDTPAAAASAASSASAATAATAASAPRAFGAGVGTPVNKGHTETKAMTQ